MSEMGSVGQNNSYFPFTLPKNKPFMISSKLIGPPSKSSRVILPVVSCNFCPGIASTATGIAFGAICFSSTLKLLLKQVVDGTTFKLLKLLHLQHLYFTRNEAPEIKYLRMLVNQLLFVLGREAKAVCVYTFTFWQQTRAAVMIEPSSLPLQQTHSKIRCNFKTGGGRQKHNKSIYNNATMTTITTAEELTSDRENKNKFLLRYLAAFDFDYTVVAQNTDTIIRDLLPDKEITKELHSIIETKGWTDYMAEVFRLLHAHGVKPHDIIEGIKKIPEVPGFIRLLKRLKQKHNFDLIIISDSNTIFINEWLKFHGLEDKIKRVFTNPAHFNEAGQLIIKPYHHQTECRMSAVNLCKGKVLEHFLIEQNLRENVRYNRVMYVGDGNNDICPVIRLRLQDIACARQGYSMEKNLAKNRTKIKVRAELLLWRTGFDLLDQLEKRLVKYTKLAETLPPTD
uniref:Pyridoxal phosphate phosphatase phospho2 n=1 Tax=Glossina brevipalpis TaxID=37001 RepID=A0A1A9WVM0_9MUSC